MKLINTFLVLFIFCNVTYGQQLLWQNNDLTANQIATRCSDTGGDGRSLDNSFWRSYVPANFGFTGDFVVQGARFVSYFNDLSGNGLSVTATVRAYTTSAAFPTGTLTQIASSDVTINSTDLQTIIFDGGGILVNSAEEIVIEIAFPASVQPDIFDASILKNDLGEIAPSYLSSAACGVPNPTDFDSIAAGNDLIIALIGEDAQLLSTEEFNVDIDDQSLQVLLYPNPSNDFINIKVSNQVDSADIHIINSIGQIVFSFKEKALTNKKINISQLTTGVYYAQIISESINQQIKFVKN